MSTRSSLSPGFPRLRRGWRVVATATAAAALLALAACAGGGGGGNDSGGEPAMSAADEDARSRVADGSTNDSAAGPAAKEAVTDVQEAASDSDPGANPAFRRAVISTGVVALRADDVAELRFDVRRVVDEHAGEITDEETESDTDGEVARSRLVVRVPADEFDATVAALEKVGDVESSQRTSEDVTTQVIDTNVRVRAQQASLERIEALLARAQSLRDIVAIESQLTRRQADLDSLKQQQAWLADQTSMSTITVHLRHTEKPSTKPKDKDDSGFLAGLASGWHGLQKVTTGALTAVGALLPFAMVLGALGLPLWLVVRRVQRRRTPAETDPATA